MIPVVAIVGRPNVGKSSLLNAFYGSRVSIVDPMPGVTRDRVSVHIEVDERAVELVDTGGIGIVDTQDLESHINEQISVAIDTADAVLFVVDVREEITALDRTVAEQLRQLSDKPVALLANKADDPKFDDLAGEFYSLGFDPVIPVSANSRRNLMDAIEWIGETIREIPEPEPREDPAMRLAIIGKRNAGKSTLVNRLAQTERCIVSEREGTTRDSVDVRFRFRDQEFVAIDTAGLRKTKAVQNSIEFYSQARSLRAIRRADVVLLLLDALADVGNIDKKAADEAMKQGRPIVIGVNKWDLAPESVTTEEFEAYIRKKLPGLAFAPVAFLSGQDGSNVWQVIALCQELYEQSTQRVSTGELNRALTAVADRRPPMVKGRRAKFYYATQIGVAPPTIVIFVNEPELVSPEYRRFLVNRFHELLPYPEVPIKVVLRRRERDDRTAHFRKLRGKR